MVLFDVGIKRVLIIWLVRSSDGLFFEGTFSGDSRYMEAYNELIEQKTEGEITMTNIYTRMLDNEIKQAVERGMKQGMEKGVEKGKSEMVKALISLGRSIKEIADFYKTDESEIEKMLSMA